MNRRAGTVVKTGSSLDSEVITIPGEAAIASNLSAAAVNISNTVSMCCAKSRIVETTVCRLPLITWLHLFHSGALLAQRLETIDRAFPLALFLTAVRGNVSWRYTGEKRL
jgi:hypothetical protein